MIRIYLIVVLVSSCIKFVCFVRIMYFFRLFLSMSFANDWPSTDLSIAGLCRNSAAQLACSHLYSGTVPMARYDGIRWCETSVATCRCCYRFGMRTRTKMKVLSRTRPWNKGHLCRSVWSALSRPNWRPCHSRTSTRTITIKKWVIVGQIPVSSAVGTYGQWLPDCTLKIG